VGEARWCCAISPISECAPPDRTVSRTTIWGSPTSCTRSRPAAPPGSARPPAARFIAPGSPREDAEGSGGASARGEHAARDAHAQREQRHVEEERDHPVGRRGATDSLAACRVL